MKFTLAILFAAASANEAMRADPLTPFEIQDFLRFVAEQGKSYNSNDEFNMRGLRWRETNTFIA